MKHMKHITLFVALLTAAIQSSTLLTMERNTEPENKKPLLSHILNAQNGKRTCDILFPVYLLLQQV